MVEHGTILAHPTLGKKSEHSLCRTSTAMTMASSSSLEDAVSELMDSPGGQLLNSARDYLRKRATALVGLFLTGLIVGFPIAKRIVTWLIEEQRLPNDVNVIVTSPVEFLMLQIQLSASFGLFLALLLVITETTLQVHVIHSFLNGFENEFPPTEAEFLVRSIHCIEHDVGDLRHSLRLGIADTDAV